MKLLSLPVAVNWQPGFGSGFRKASDKSGIDKKE
jgi:hypothetical protein